MDTDYIVLLANTPTQAESLQHSLELADKTGSMYFNQKGNISTLNGGSLELVDKFTYLGNSVSSTENNINVGLAKA